MVSLRGREPCNPLAFRVWLDGVINSKQDSVNIGCIWRCLTGRLEVCHWYLDIDGANLVWPRVFWKRRYEVDLLQETRHLFSVSGLVGLCWNGSKGRIARAVAGARKQVERPSNRSVAHFLCSKFAGTGRPYWRDPRMQNGQVA